MRTPFAPLSTTVVLLLALAPQSPRAEPSDGPLAKLLEGAHAQVGVTVKYDGSYRRIAYPGGDVPADRGVCTDVIVRAYRAAGFDLQVLVHRDMTAAFDAYPRRWGRTRPDPNIDHRRVLNLATFFRRHGRVLPVTREPADYRPGDLVTWRLPSGLPHIGIVSDREASGRPLVVHNIGAGTKAEDALFRFPITGRYRYEPWSDAPAEPAPD